SGCRPLSNMASPCGWSIRKHGTGTRRRPGTFSRKPAVGPVSQPQVRAKSRIDRWPRLGRMAYSRAMRRPVVWSDPTNRCFGCSPDNPHGLGLRFFETDAGVEIDYTAPDRVEGAPGIVHGGVQATILDEAFCVTVHAKRGHR